MKKIICVNNQEDLTKALSTIEDEIEDQSLQKKIFNIPDYPARLINKVVFKEERNQKNLIVIDYLLINNLGISLLKETINYYNKYQHLIILNVEDSLSFLLFAIENGFNFIFTTIKDYDISNIKKLAEKHDCKIFNFTENIFECLIVN